MVTSLGLKKTQKIIILYYSMSLSEWFALVIMYHVGGDHRIYQNLLWNMEWNLSNSQQKGSPSTHSSTMHRPNYKTIKFLFWHQMLQYCVLYSRYGLIVIFQCVQRLNTCSARPTEKLSLASIKHNRRLIFIPSVLYM